MMRKRGSHVTISGLRLLAAGVLGFGFWMPAGHAWADPIAEIEGRYWMTELSSRVKSTEAGLGTKIDLKEDLGVNDENFPDMRVNFHAGPLGRLRLGYTRASLSGDRTVARDLVFEGNTFTAGTRVVTDFESNYLRLGWLWQASFLNTVKLGPILEAKGFWGKTSLESPGTLPPVKETESFSFGLPTIGAALNVTPLNTVDLFAEVSGVPAGNLGYFVDAEAGIKIIPFKSLSILAGYRIFDIKVESGRDSARLELHGPFVGASVRF